MLQSGMPAVQGHTCFISTCPRHKRRLKLGDTDTLFINMTTGELLYYRSAKHVHGSRFWATLHLLRDGVVLAFRGVFDE